MDPSYPRFQENMIGRCCTLRYDAVLGRNGNSQNHKTRHVMWRVFVDTNMGFLSLFAHPLDCPLSFVLLRVDEVEDGFMAIYVCFVPLGASWRYMVGIDAFWRRRPFDEGPLAVFNKIRSLLFLELSRVSVHALMRQLLAILDWPWVAGTDPAHLVIPKIFVLRTLDRIPSLPHRALLRIIAGFGIQNITRIKTVRALIFNAKTEVSLVFFLQFIEILFLLECRFADTFVFLLHFNHYFVDLKLKQQSFLKLYLQKRSSGDHGVRACVPGN